MFKFSSPAIEEKFNKLVMATTGQEPCVDPNLMDPLRLNDSPTDMWVEGWTGKHTVSRDVAEEMCIECPVYTLCRDYAVTAKEPYGIWGGTRPQDRGISKNRR